MTNVSSSQEIKPYLKKVIKASPIQASLRFVAIVDTAIFITNIN